jgi:hypothetical protein
MKAEDMGGGLVGVKSEEREGSGVVWKALDRKTALLPSGPKRVDPAKLAVRSNLGEAITRQVT